MLHLLRLEISHEVIHDVANCKPMVVEYILSILRNRIEDELVRLHAEKHQVWPLLKKYYMVLFEHQV